jgi:hypothetical protein
VAVYGIIGVESHIFAIEVVIRWSRGPVICTYMAQYRVQSGAVTFLVSIVRVLLLKVNDGLL